MDAFAAELMRRSPLAGAVLEVADHIFDDVLLDSIYDAHRGRSYEDVLRFPDFLRLVRDALIRHDGSAHQLFLELERHDAHPVDESNFYRKLSHVPVELSRALLLACSARIRPLMPCDVVPLPSCFDGFVALAADGKKIKNVSKRLKPTRGYSGRLLGAKAVVAMDVRSGLALAMSDSLDGEANDVPLVPSLMEQLRGSIDRPMLTIWDRQFGDAATLNLLSGRPGDAYLVRLRKGLIFQCESCHTTIDDAGRQVIDETGMPGRGRPALRVRRVTLRRPGEEDVQLVTNLLDGRMFSASDLLALYKRRWGIEQVFQQVTETFALDHLIGCSPRAVLLQFAVCLLMYNLLQLIKSYVSEDGAVLASVVSMFYLFIDVRTQLKAWAHHSDDEWPRACRDTTSMRRRLRELLKGSWQKRYTKASDKRPRARPGVPKRIPGGHTSVQRLLDQAK